MYEKAIADYQPMDELEVQDKKIILDYIKQFSHNVLTRENKVAHLTSSGFILNEKKNKVLMVYHNLYQSWAWTGGHADGEANLLAVAIKEAREETGIRTVKPLSQSIQSLDILPVWRHKKKDLFVSSHLHLNVSYLLMADEDEELKVKNDENSAVQWIEISQLEAYCTETPLIPIYKKLIKAAQINT